MNISEPEIRQNSPFVKLLYLKNAISSSRLQIIEKTLLSSPIVLNIYPFFRVQVNKPFQGLPPESFNDVNLQNLMERDVDSQRDAFGDDMDCDLFSGESTLCRRKSQMHFLPQPVVKEIRVFVNLTSLRINGVLFPFKAAVRSSCIIRTSPMLIGVGERNSEDSLLIALKSGFLLLVKIFWVPQDFSDGDYTLRNGHIAPDEGNNIFKPFVVQWWKTENLVSASSIGSTGYSLHAQRLGLLVASMSRAGSFRIHNVQYSQIGMLLQKHFNIDAGGIILNSCFASPKLNRLEDHCMLLVMVLMSDDRSQLTLYSWRTGVAWSSGLAKSEFPLMLPAAHDICAPPIFIAPLGEVGGFLFVYEHKIVIVTIHQLLSADYTFRTMPSPWTNSGFPTTYYSLLKPINDNLQSGCDEVHIATDKGLIYAMIISDTRATVWRTFTVKDPISIFTMEKAEHDVSLICSSYGGSCRDYLINGQIVASHEIVSCRDRPVATVINKYQNWAPVIDVAVVQSDVSGTSNPELWGIAGFGESRKLCHFKSGYRATRKGESYRGFNNADKFYQVEIGQRQLLFVSLSSSTRLLCFNATPNNSVVEVENDCFIHDERTLLASKVCNERGEFIIQITSANILLTNLADANMYLNIGQNRILMADILNGKIAIVADDSDEKKINLKIFSLDFDMEVDNASNSGDDSENDFAVATLIHQVEIVSVISCIKFLKGTDGPLMMVGDFSGGVQLFSVSDSSLVNIGTYQLSEACREPEPRGWGRDHLVAQSACQLGNLLNVGTTDGFLYQFEIKAQNHGFTLLRAIKVGHSPVGFATIRGKKHLLAVKSSSIWMIDTLESPFPNQVCFSHPLLSRPVREFVEIPNVSHDQSRICMALIHEGSLMIFTVSCFVDGAIQRLPIKGLPTKMLFIEDIDAFILLCATKSHKDKLKLVRRLLLNLIRHTGVKTKDSRASLFSEDESPLCASVWRVERNEKISKLVLLGSSLQEGDTVKGSLKVVDIAIGTSRRRPPQAQIVELTSIATKGPISGIAQIDSDILLVIDDLIYVTSYDSEEKRLVPIRLLVTLPGEVATITIENDSKVTVMTKLDSITVFKYSKNDLLCSLDVFWSDTSLTQCISHGKLGAYLVLSLKRLSALSMIEDGQTVTEAFNFRMPCLSRIFSSNFNLLWARTNQNSYDETTEDSIICVGVSGDVISFRVADKLGLEMKELARRLNSKAHSIDLVTEQTEMLATPFSDKVSGTGLFAINRQTFGYVENRNASLDFDFPELKRVADVVVGI